MSVTRIAKKITSDILSGENLDAYSAIAIGITLTILGIFISLKQAWLDNFILLSLTLMIVVSLRSRFLIEEVARKFPGQTTKDASTVLQDQSDYQSLDDRLQGAGEVIVIGEHLLGFISFNRDVLTRYAKLGACYRFIILDPALPGIPASIRKDINRTLQVLSEMAAENGGRIDVRITRRSLPSSIFAVDIATPRGLIQVQPRSLFTDGDHRAHFDLRASPGSKWYQHYREQIGFLWDASAPRIG